LLFASRIVPLPRAGFGTLLSAGCRALRRASSLTPLSMYSSDYISRVTIPSKPVPLVFYFYPPKPDQANQLRAGSGNRLNKPKYRSALCRSWNRYRRSFTQSNEEAERGDRHHNGGDRQQPDRERPLSMLRSEVRQPVIGMIGGSDTWLPHFFDQFLLRIHLPTWSMAVVDGGLNAPRPLRSC
jgi:hypothetical protein